MKEFSCGDVVPGCQMRFRASSEDDVLLQVGKHAHDDHGLHEVSEALASAVRAKIIDVQD